METGADLWKRYKDIADMLSRGIKKVYIKDVEGNLYFCYILFVGEETIRIKCFGPEQRKDQSFTLYYPMIERINEYEEREGSA